MKTTLHIKMKTVATQFGKSFEADFGENTWSFQMDDKYIVRAGEFAIVDKPVYDEMLECLRLFFTENIMTAELRDRCKLAFDKANESEK